VVARSGFSAQTLSVLAVLRDQQSEWRHGHALAKQTGLKSGTPHPILIRLTVDGRAAAAAALANVAKHDARRRTWAQPVEGRAIARPVP